MSEVIKYTILPNGRLKAVNNGIEYDHYGYEYMLASDYTTLEAETRKMAEMLTDPMTDCRKSHAEYAQAWLDVHPKVP
jgi:hypothetical protein